MRSQRVRHDLATKPQPPLILGKDVPESGKATGPNVEPLPPAKLPSWAVPQVPPRFPSTAGSRAVLPLALTSPHSLPTTLSSAGASSCSSGSCFSHFQSCLLPCHENCIPSHDLDLSPRQISSPTQPIQSDPGASSHQADPKPLNEKPDKPAPSRVSAALPESTSDELKA